VDDEDGEREEAGAAAPRTSSRRWFAETGEPAPPRPSCLYNGDDMGGSKLTQELG
jgi:hypothetical protein